MSEVTDNNSGYESDEGNEASVDKGIYCDDCSVDDSLSDQEGSLVLPKREENPLLPETVTILQGEHGSKVYLIGTSHFSKKSQEDVEETIKKTQPNVVVLELCQSRLSILSLNEETILEESKSLSVDKLRRNIKEHGMVQGIMYMLLLTLSAHLTKELGMAPGGEFRRAFKQARKIPGCIIHLGDRPVHITLRRAISSLSVWQKMKLAYGILFSRETITKEEVERCKQRDLLEEMLAEMTGEFPALSKVFVDERDVYLTYALQLAASPIPDVSPDNKNIFQPAVVVGVVGIGHVPGIVKHWSKVQDADIPPLLTLPKKGMVSIVIGKGIKYSMLGLIAYGCYRFLIPTEITTTVVDIHSRAFEYLRNTIQQLPIHGSLF